MIEYKKKLLITEQPNCSLEYISLDLADGDKRRALLAELAGRGTDLLVLTEGVIPYLTETQVGELASELHSHPSFKNWIAEYFDKEIYGYFKNPKRMKMMKNAPFLFLPNDWFGFFRKHGWAPGEIKYTVEESEKLKRDMPTPWWVYLFYILRPFMKKEKFYKFKRFTAYVRFERAATF